MTPLERTRAAIANARAEVQIAQIVADATMAVASSGPRACRIALRAAQALDVARRDLARLEGGIGESERFDVDSRERARLESQRATATPLSDAERLQLAAIVPQRRRDGRNVPIAIHPGVEEATWIQAIGQAQRNAKDEWIEPAARGPLAAKLRTLLALYESKFNAPPSDGGAHYEVKNP